VIACLLIQFGTYQGLGKKTTLPIIPKISVVITPTILKKQIVIGDINTHGYKPIYPFLLE
jgi:hypothetical protein